MNWNNVWNVVQLTFYSAGIIVLILVGAEVVSSKAKMDRAHERIMSIADRTLHEVICQ
jgi:hypothetical protein